MKVGEDIGISIAFMDEQSKKIVYSGPVNIFVIHENEEIQKTTIVGIKDSSGMPLKKLHFLPLVISYYVQI